MVVSQFRPELLLLAEAAVPELPQEYNQGFSFGEEVEVFF